MKASFVPLTLSFRSALVGAALCLTSAASIAAQSQSAATAQQPESTSGAATVSEPPEAAQLREQFTKIQAQIDNAQRQAESTPAVKEVHTKFQAVVRDAMIKEDPKVAAMLDSHDKLVAELSGSKELNLPDEQRSPEFQTKFKSYKEQRSQIEAVAAKVAQKPEVVSSQKKYEGALNEEMSKVEPGLPKLVEQRDAIAAHYRELVLAKH